MKTKQPVHSRSIRSSFLFSALLPCVAVLVLLAWPLAIKANPCVNFGFTQQPVGQTNSPGTTATFTVFADGGPQPATYQWLKNGTNLTDNGRISGATNNTLNITDVSAADIGEYRAVAISGVCVITSEAAWLEVVSGAAVIVDDTWADGTRNDQNLPAESAWYASSSASLIAQTGSMIGTNLTGSRLWVTYFTDGSQVSLAVGETLKVTMVFIPDDVVITPATLRGLRIGLFNYGGGTRLTSDSFSASAGNGAGVTGYMLNMNFAQAFTTSSPLEVRKRINPDSPDLMGSSGDYQVLGAGGGYNGSPGFTNGTQYTLEFSVTRTSDDEVVVRNRFFGDNLDIYVEVMDYFNTTFAFDAFAIRPAANSSADHFRFVEFKVEGPALSGESPLIILEPEDAFGTSNSNARFSVTATGTPSLRYQWYFKTNTPLLDATNSWYTLANLSNGNVGRYSVIISNDSGSVTSRYALLTVNPAIPGGLLVNDTWADGDRGNGPFSVSNSIWFNCGASAITALTNLAPGTMTGLVQTNSRTWLTYFTSHRGDVVHLDPGQTLKITLNFSATGISDNTNADLRFGLFNYSALGATRLADDFGSSQAQAANVSGYMLGVNFSSTFHTNNGPVPMFVPPLEFRVRTNLVSTDLLGNADVNYDKFAEGGAGERDPGFSSGQGYCLQFFVSRINTSTVSLIAGFIGPGLNVWLSATDTTGTNNVDFDTFATRPNNTNTCGTEFTFTRFKVELLPPLPPFRISAAQRPTSDQMKLTWESIPFVVYEVQSRDSLGAGNWSSNATVTATRGATAWTNSGTSSTAKRFYRVVATE